MISKNELVTDLKSMGVELGDILNIKASLKSVGPIDGGAQTLLDAILEAVGPEGTIVVDSFVSVYSPFSFSYWQKIVSQETSSYAGALANLVIQYPGSFRSTHPIQKFSVIGKYAERLTRNHTPEAYAYGVLREITDLGGKNLKIGSDEKVPGVGTTHVAIGIAKIRQRRPRLGVRYMRGSKVQHYFINWSGGCMRSFYQLNNYYDNHHGGVIKRGFVGKAPSKITSMKKTLNIELDLIKKDRNSFLKCGQDDCIVCRFSWENGEEGFIKYAALCLRAGKLILALKAFRQRYIYRYLF